jgi:uncharacterized protein (UPF0248 family)
MLPIRDLLNRIRWDREFAKATFEIGYLDHVERRTILVPFRSLHFPEGDSFSFQVEDESGELMTIPLHRIREVRRNGALIWQRPL